jgi:16S rRNA A1518/A1519 N6-dimethyltransferase RsmA/KsgA/DIM1 with predicted DNA glycosylase/AP lyase activity
MNDETLRRLHGLRMENDAAGFAMDEQRPRFESMEARHENGTAPRAVSAFQLFQTPAELARRLVSAARIEPRMRVLEPSCGLGRLLDAMPPACEVVAVEIAAQCAAEIFRQNRDGVTLLQRDFLTCQPGELGTFDRVAMNPPFRMRSDIRHILHALKFVKNGGVLAALCLDTPQRETALRHLSATWEKIPAGAFKQSATNVRTVLATFSK